MASTNDNSNPMDSTRKSLPRISKAKIVDAMNRTNFRFSTPVLYRVPNELRKRNESAYTPRLVSIGPLHRKNEHLEPRMLDIKLSYVGSLLGDTCKKVDADAEDVLEECLKQMKDSIDEAKKFYAAEVDDLDEHMLVIDGCFILEVLRRGYPGEKPHAEKNESSNQVTEKESFKEPIFNFPTTREAVKNDLLLLENQLPFSVLRTLFNCTMGRRPNSPPLLHYVHSFFYKRWRIGSKCNDSNATNCGQPGDCVVSLVDYDHILHFVHCHYLDHPQPAEVGHVKSNGKASAYMGCSKMPSASDLAVAGVKFEPCEHLFEVKFERRGCLRRACFRIPTLCVDEFTEPILRNLIALEQCCPGLKHRFTSYAYLMDRLVNTEKDVEVLERYGVIHNSLGTSKEASRFFNDLRKEVFVDGNDDFYSQIHQDAVNYSKLCFSRSIPTTVSHIESKFRATPWVAIAFSIGIISFFMAATNFIRSFLD